MPLQLGLLEIYIPFFDATLGSIEYNNWAYSYLLDTDTGQDNKYQIINEQAGLNAANPVWLSITNNTPIMSFTALTGSGETTKTSIPIARVQVTITKANPLPDRWYGSAEFGVYGVIQPSSASYVDKPLFINSTNSAFPLDFLNGSESITYSLKAGVEATIEVFANAYQEGDAFIKYAYDGGPIQVHPYPVWDFA